MEGMQRGPDRTTLAAFGMATLLGAGNFLAVRYSNTGLDPFWGAGVRFTCSTALFVAIALTVRAAWPRGRQLALTVVYGVLSFGLFFALMYWALLRVTAGVTTVVMAVVPMMTLLLAWAHRMEPLRARNVTGATLALLGISWMAIRPGTQLPLGPLLAMLLAAVCIGESIIVAKRVSANHPAVTNAIGMGTGALLLLVFSLVAGETWAGPTTREAAWAVLYLVTFGSVGLFALVLYVVERWTASASSYAFVLFPVVTMILEATIADVPLRTEALAGATIVVSGVWFGALSTRARSQSSPTPEPAPVGQA
jgi:drug/metabolite transporter (DMT)-like permease